MLDTPARYVVRSPEGGWRIEGSRVSLDSVVHGYLQGASAEGIADSFPTLSLEQIHGAIAFYLRNREEIDAHLAEQQAGWRMLCEESEAANRPLLSRVRAARKGSGQEPAP